MKLTSFLLYKNEIKEISNMTTREKVLAELKDILAVSDVEDELSTQDSVLDLVDVIFMEDDGSITADEQDQVSELIYDLDKSPVEVAEAIVAILSAETVAISEDIDPFVDDIWEDDSVWDDLSDEEVAALTSDDGINWAEYPDHEYQEGCDGKDCTEEIDEAYYGKDSIIAGDIPGKTNGFVELISMRFHNMGFDEGTCTLTPGKFKHAWNPFGDDSVVMYGPSREFFDPIVAYIESEVDREDSAWYNRDYEVVEVDDYMSTPDPEFPGIGGPWALCIEAKEYDRDTPDNLPMTIKAEYARRRRMRKANDKPAA